MSNLEKIWSKRKRSKKDEKDLQELIDSLPKTLSDEEIGLCMEPFDEKDNTFFETIGTPASKELMDSLFNFKPSSENPGIHSLPSFTKMKNPEGGTPIPDDQLEKIVKDFSQHNMA